MEQPKCNREDRVKPRGSPLADSFLSTGSIALDGLLKGGYPRGRQVEIRGADAAGKTTLALHAIAAMQDRGGVCVFMDGEHAFPEVYAREIGVNLNHLLVAQPDTIDQWFGIALQMLRSQAIDLMVFDSMQMLAGLTWEKRQARALDAQHRRFFLSFLQCAYRKGTILMVTCPDTEAERSHQRGWIDRTRYFSPWIQLMISPSISRQGWCRGVRSASIGVFARHCGVGAGSAWRGPIQFLIRHGKGLSGGEIKRIAASDCAIQRETQRVRCV